MNKFDKKENWGEGEWQNEPDRLEFEHSGFPCLLLRNIAVTGSWCGYVALPPSHPYFEKSYDDIDEDLEVHGGLTYNSHCQGDICHKPKTDESDNVWWLGFDCAHFGDLSPRLAALMDSLYSPFLPFNEHYKNLNYVKRETEKLAKQLAEVAK